MKKKNLNVIKFPEKRCMMAVNEAEELEQVFVDIVEAGCKNGDPELLRRLGIRMMTFILAVDQCV